MLLIGSRALQFLFPNINMREPKDWDFICTEEEYTYVRSELLHDVLTDTFVDIPIECTKWDKRAFKLKGTGS